MIYAQFYTDAVNVSIPKLIPACGSDGVVILDARRKIDNLIPIVLEKARQMRAIHTYKAFRIFRTDSLRNEGRPMTLMIEISQPQDEMPDDVVWPKARVSRTA